MNKGLVTVVTPAFNCESTIGDVVRSVAEQGEIVLEHIIIDDGSTDSTLTMIESLLHDFPKVRLLKQVNSGAGAARNNGIKNAKGRFVAFLDADDIWLPGKLDVQIGFMCDNDCVFSYGDYCEYDIAKGREVGCYDFPSELRYRDLLEGCPVGCLTAVYDQSVLGKKFMPLVRRGQDWGLWLSIARDGVVAKKYPGIFAVYNINDSSLSKNKMKKIFDVFYIYRREEGLSFLSSLRYVFLHIIYVLNKSKMKVDV